MSQTHSPTQHSVEKSSKTQSLFFRQTNVFTREVTKELISRKLMFYKIRSKERNFEIDLTKKICVSVKFSLFHTVS